MRHTTKAVQILKWIARYAQENKDYKVNDNKYVNRQITRSDMIQHVIIYYVATPILNEIKNEG